MRFRPMRPAAAACCSSAETAITAGDGCAAARLWMQRGGKADVWLLKSPSQMKGDAGVNACLLNSCGASLNVLYNEAPEVPKDCAAIVDALYGTGLSRELSGAALAAVQRMNESGRRRRGGYPLRRGWRDRAGARRRGACAGNGDVSSRQARPAALSGPRVCGQADRRGYRAFCPNGTARRASTCWRKPTRARCCPSAPETGIRARSAMCSAWPEARAWPGRRRFVPVRRCAQARGW